MTPRRNAPLADVEHAARRVQQGDKVIVITYCQMEAEQARNYAPTVVLLDENNDVVVR